MEGRKKMFLFAVHTARNLKSFNPCYVVSDNMQDAADLVTKTLEDANYGFSDERKVLRVEIIAENYLYAASGHTLYFNNETPISLGKPNKGNAAQECDATMPNSNS